MLNVKTYLLHGKYVISLLYAYKLIQMFLEFDKLCIIQVKCRAQNFPKLNADFLSLISA